MILSLFRMDCEQDDVTRCLCARRNHNEVDGLLRLSIRTQVPARSITGQGMNTLLSVAASHSVLCTYISSLVASLLSRQLDPTACNRLGPALDRGQGFCGGKPKCSITQEAWRNASRSNRSARAVWPAAIVIVIDTIGRLEAGSILGQDPGVGSRL